MQNNLATEILARSHLRLCWSDGDPQSRGTVLDPAEMVGWRVAYLAAGHCEGYRTGFGHSGRAGRPEDDLSAVGFSCIGTEHGRELTDADALRAVQWLCGVRTRPEWLREVWHDRKPAGAEFLLVEDGACHRHGLDHHHAGWTCRIWVEAEDGPAVDLTRIDWAAMALLRAELEAQAALDEARALMARVEIRERARVWREEQNQIRADARLAANRSNPAEVPQRNSSTSAPNMGGVGSGADTPSDMGESPSEAPPSGVGRVSGASPFLER